MPSESLFNNACGMNSCVRREFKANLDEVHIAGVSLRAGPQWAQTRPHLVDQGTRWNLRPSDGEPEGGSTAGRIDPIAEGAQLNRFVFVAEAQGNHHLLYFGIKAHAGGLWMFMISALYPRGQAPGETNTAPPPLGIASATFDPDAKHSARHCCN